jgi:hypothetical protein
MPQRNVHCWAAASILQFKAQGDLCSLLLPNNPAYRYICRYPRAPIGFHRVQLTLHDGQLAPENAGGNNAHQHQSEGKQTDMARPPRHRSLIDLMWGFAFLAASAAVLVSLKGEEYADDHGLPWWLPLLGFLGLALVFDYQGLTLLTSTNRFPKISEFPVL